MNHTDAMNRYIRPIIIAALLVAGTTSTSARLRYGFRFGGDFAAARLKDAPDATLKNRSGFSGGLVLEYQLPKCGFAPDIALLYTRYSTRLAEQGKHPESFGRNFIEIPLHLKYKFWLKSTHNLFAPMIYTGPSVAFRVGHHSSSVMETDIAQAGWDVGIGFDLVNFIQISGGYRFGLGNAIKNYTTYPDAVMRTDAWNISATLLFDF